MVLNMLSILNNHLVLLIILTQLSKYLVVVLYPTIPLPCGLVTSISRPSIHQYDIALFIALNLFKRILSLRFQWILSTLCYLSHASPLIPILYHDFRILTPLNTLLPFVRRLSKVFLVSWDLALEELVGREVTGSLRSFVL